MSKVVGIGKLSSQIAGELAKYNKRVRDRVKDIVDDVSTELAESVKRDSPVGSRTKKKYRNGWTATTAFENANTKRVVVHNKTNYQLTHLLEHGHDMGNKRGRARAFVHVQPNNAKAQKKLVKEIEQAVKNEA